MSKILKNTLIALSVLILLIIGYYMILQRGSMTLSLGNGSANVSEQLFSQTEVFIERRRKLESLSLDLSIFNDPSFISLVSYTTAIEDQPVGKSDIFDIAQ